VTALPSHGGAREETKLSFARGAALLSVLVGVTGVLTYSFFALVAHALDKGDRGDISVLWSAVFLVASVIYRPVEQLISRSIAEHHARGRSAAAPIRVAATIQVSLAVLFALVALALKGTIQDRLFSGSEVIYWSLVGAVIFYAASYFARGFLAGQRKFGLYGALVMMESSSRVVFAVLLVAGALNGRGTAAVAIAAAPLLSLIVVPWALGRQVRRLAGSSGEEDDDDGERFTISQGMGFASAVLVVMFSEQAILNSGALVVRVTADQNARALAGSVFFVLMIARAPLQLFQAVSTTLLPHLTRLLVRERAAAHTGEFGSSVRVTAFACLGFGAATVIGVLALGPPVMKLLFRYDYDRGGLAMVAAGMGLYLAATTLNQAALAQGRARRAAASWAASATFFVAFLVAAQIGEVREVEIAFLGTAALLATLLFAVYRRPIEAGEVAVAPGSLEELEARLAAADEGA
jgi:O-antigen/teichoic acid export membrane protein